MCLQLCHGPEASWADWRSYDVWNDGQASQQNWEWTFQAYHNTITTVRHQVMSKFKVLSKRERGVIKTKLYIVFGVIRVPLKKLKAKSDYP